MPDAYSYIRDALDVWCPDWPRRVTTKQRWADNPDSAIELLQEAEQDAGMEPYISSYSFPRGHTKGGNIPRINTLFIDFDFDGGNYEGDGDEDAWRRDLSQLLVRVRMVAKTIAQHGDGGWRAALSGHKGVHLFLDFPALPSTAADFPQFIDGLEQYADELVSMLAERSSVSDLNRYVDVTSSDLGRLCRVPNTRHNSASRAFGEDRYCVPVTISELAQIDVDTYRELTQSRREVPYESRDPSESVNDVLIQHIRHASSPSRSKNRTSSVSDRSRVTEYKQESNDAITLDDIRFLTSDRPCVWKFYERDDKYQYGNQSHYAELFCIRELIEKNVPINVIHEFLDSAPEYTYEYSQNQIEQVIARNYKRFSIESMFQNAPEFCRYDDCEFCNKVADNL